jgi:hypothetical protein
LSVGALQNPEPKQGRRKALWGNTLLHHQPVLAESPLEGRLRPAELPCEKQHAHYGLPKGATDLQWSPGKGSAVFQCGLSSWWHYPDCYFGGHPPGSKQPGEAFTQLCEVLCCCG